MGQKTSKRLPRAEQQAADALLREAARASDTRAICALAERGARLDAADERGMTALHVAAELGLSPTVRLLLWLGHPVAPRTSFGYTPLHFAAENGHTSACGALVSFGADPHEPCGEGWTPLGLALHHRETNTASVLRQRCAAARGGPTNVAKDVPRPAVSAAARSASCPV